MLGPLVVATEPDPAVSGERNPHQKEEKGRDA